MDVESGRHRKRVSLGDDSLSVLSCCFLRHENFVVSLLFQARSYLSRIRARKSYQTVRSLFLGSLPLRSRIRHIWSLRERLRAVCVSHLPWGLRSSELVGPCREEVSRHAQPKERYRSSPISPRNCMIRILFFPIVSILPLATKDPGSQK